MTKKQAIRQIYKHVQQKGQTPVVATQSNVLYWWHRLNHAVFDQQLQTPNYIICRQIRNHYGWCDGNTKSVTLAITTAELPRKVFLEVLAHEMIHQWQWYNNLPMSHGDSFWKWRPILNRTLTLTLWQTL